MSTVLPYVRRSVTCAVIWHKYSCARCRPKEANSVKRNGKRTVLECCAPSNVTVIASCQDLESANCINVAWKMAFSSSKRSINIAEYVFILCISFVHCVLLLILSVTCLVCENWEILQQIYLTGNQKAAGLIQLCYK